MLKIRQTSATANSNDLGVVIKKATNIGFYAIEDSLINDTLIKKEDTINNTFDKTIYDDTDDNRFTDIINFKMSYYGYSLRLVHDDAIKNMFLIYNPDYIPLINTVNRSTTMLKVDLGGIKRITKDYSTLGKYDNLSHSLIGGDDNDVAIPKPNTDSTSTNAVTTSDFELIRLNLRGILNPFNTRLRINDNTGLADYLDTNEVYMLKINKKKVLGADTNIHLHQLLPKTLNKFSVEYIGRQSDIENVYLPVQL